jgi:hypothetical protein
VKCHAESLTKLCGDISVSVNNRIAIQKYTEVKILRTKILPVVCIGVHVGVQGGV